MRLPTLAALALALLAADAAAGPIRNFLANRRAERRGGAACQLPPAAAFRPAAGAGPTRPAVATGSCPGGACVPGVHGAVPIYGQPCPGGACPAPNTKVTDPSCPCPLGVCTCGPDGCKCQRPAAGGASAAPLYPAVRAADRPGVCAGCTPTPGNGLPAVTCGPGGCRVVAAAPAAGREAFWHLEANGITPKTDPTYLRLVGTHGTPDEKRAVARAIIGGTLRDNPDPTVEPDGSILMGPPGSGVYRLPNGAVTMGLRCPPTAPAVPVDSDAGVEVIQSGGDPAAVKAAIDASPRPLTPPGTQLWRVPTLPGEYTEAELRRLYPGIRFPHDPAAVYAPACPNGRCYAR